MYNFVSIDGILEKNSSFPRDFTPVFYNSAIMSRNIWPAIYISHIQLFTERRTMTNRPQAAPAAHSIQQKKQRTSPVLCFFPYPFPAPQNPFPSVPGTSPAQAEQYHYSKYSRYSSEKIFPPSRLIPPYKCCIIRGSIASRFFVSIICIIS